MRERRSESKRKSDRERERERERERRSKERWRWRWRKETEKKNLRERTGSWGANVMLTTTADCQNNRHVQGKRGLRDHEGAQTLQITGRHAVMSMGLRRPHTDEPAPPDTHLWTEDEQQRTLTHRHTHSLTHEQTCCASSGGTRTNSS